MKYILAIDLGTSGPKVGLATLQGEVIAYEFEATPTLLLPNGGAEQRPDDWWRGIKVALARLLDRRLIPLDDLAAISCTTQWAGTLAIDQNLQPLMNAIVWMDARGAPYIDRMVGGVLAIQGYDLAKLFTWIRLAGGVPTHSGKDPIAHISYLKHEVPDVYRAAYKFLEPKDYLNARLTGRGIKPTTKADKYLATFEVLYTPGELKAVGYASNQPVAECQLKTAGVPQRIRLAPDGQTISAEKGDLCFITVEIVDQDGLMHPSADHTIYFTVKGEGTIAAVGSSNPLSQESYRGNCRSAYRGRCLVVVKSSRQGGTIHLCAQADGLEGAEITIQAA